MVTETAIDTLEALAKGINPTTGELLPDDSALNKPEVIRALYDLVGNSSSKDALPPNQGTPWTKELKSELENLLSDGKSVKELADHFGRTAGAIRSELKHQGLS